MMKLSLTSCLSLRLLLRYYLLVLVYLFLGLLQAWLYRRAADATT